VLKREQTVNRKGVSSAKYMNWGSQKGKRKKISILSKRKWGGTSGWRQAHLWGIQVAYELGATTALREYRQIVVPAQGRWAAACITRGSGAEPA